MPHSKEYLERFMRPDWQVLRARLLQQAQYTCQRCGFATNAKGLQLHHKNYDRLGHERDEDLIVLCLECHAKADTERRVRTAEAAYYRRLDGWASKVYGENWDDNLNRLDEIEDEFEAWLERKRKDW
jgi:hypothetical protein